MIRGFDLRRSEAIRAGLIVHATGARRRIRRGLWGIGLVLAGVIAGAGASAAAFAATGTLGSGTTAAGVVIEQPDGSGGSGDAALEPIDAPPGTTPGASVASMLGAPLAQTIVAETRLDLSDRPAAATHVRVTVTCLTAGSISWGTDPAGNNPSSSCTVADLGAEPASAWMDVPLDAATDALYITPGEGAEASVVLQYETLIPTRLGVNANGETYGIETAAQGRPDLILVQGTASDGTAVAGYVRATELDAADGASGFAMTTEPRDIPVYESDGTTRIGIFHVGD
ncbi:MAG: hypothetical protein QM626_04950 [Microbacterium sp.]|uniref:hypothetical protein n=1 Tax=Microbacterium sp. TaxID=51671 RepID=UPI0039E609C4